MFVDIFSDQYVGCYQPPKKGVDTGFPHMQQPSRLLNNTVDNCVEYCRGQNYTYAGLRVCDVISFVIPLYYNLSSLQSSSSLILASLSSSLLLFQSLSLLLSSLSLLPLSPSCHHHSCHRHYHIGAVVIMVITYLSHEQSFCTANSYSSAQNLIGKFSRLHD